MPPDAIRVTFEDILAFVSEPDVGRPFQGRRVETVVEPDTRTGLSCADQVPLHPVVSRPDEVIQQWTIKRCRTKYNNLCRDAASSKGSSPRGPWLHPPLTCSARRRCSVSRRRRARWSVSSR